MGTAVSVRVRHRTRFVPVVFAFAVLFEQCGGRAAPAGPPVFQAVAGQAGDVVPLRESPRAVGFHKGRAGPAPVGHKACVLAAVLALRPLVLGVFLLGVGQLCRGEGGVLLGDGADFFQGAELGGGVQLVTACCCCSCCCFYYLFLWSVGYQ